MARGRIYVESSLLHGRGVFASAPFRRGDYIATARGTRSETDGRYVLWVLEGEGSYRGVKVVNQLQYLNHSPKPNAEFWGAELYAIRAIKPGEEITFDYGGG
jgi:SET domain-containing protein